MVVLKCTTSYYSTTKSATLCPTIHVSFYHNAHSVVNLLSVCLTMLFSFLTILFVFFFEYINADVVVVVVVCSLLFVLFFLLLVGSRPKSTQSKHG